MRLFDEQKRLFGIVNPIDAIAILAAVVVVVVVANVLFGVNPKTIRVGHGNRKVEMVVRCPNVTFFDPSYISAGEKAIKVGGANVMGTVSSVRSESSTVEAFDADGNPHVSHSSIARDVFVTVDGTGDISGDGAFIGDEQVRVNMLFDFATPRFQADRCRVIALKVVD